ncbi:fch and double sh3 domains protein 2 [Echinococcus multilocularis]|uniref:Fch and double sh3 domains protein 2 n=1 Tax=Echinococcus multilocularis TaxID=6211 RepID=A0A087W252_ECHMU|nr:fch and double sh3 domains protein 2 [Echinococcus multilocularis]
MQDSTKKSQLKYIQSEHFSRLLSKQNNETELLEDMRSFCKQRAILDKEYGQALQKLCSSFLSKKEFLALPNPPNTGHRSVWDIWKLFLQEFNALALSHLKLAEVHHRLSLELKPVKSLRVAVSKRIFEQLKSLQNDLAASMQEMVKSQKIYSEEEKQAHETRLKAMNIEDKLRRRSTNLFSTMAQLHRNHAKISQRRDEYENRSAGARNEYLFQLTAINAHLDHYLKTDIPDLAQILDGDVYDRFREVLSKTSEMELEICRHHQDPFKALLEESSKINRKTAWENFIKELPIFSADVEFHFEPRDGDTISSLLSVNAKEGSFEQVAKKLARRFVTRERRIKSYRQEINDLCSGRISPSPGMSVSLSQVPSPPRKFPLKDCDTSEDSGALNQEYVENKVEELEFAIRREEIEKTKISACLELLKKTHVDVQAALYEANLAATEVRTGTVGRGMEVAEKAQHGASSSSTAATGSSSTEGSTVGLTGLLTDSTKHRNSFLLENAFAPLNSFIPRSCTQNGGISRTSAQQLANEAWAQANAASPGANDEPSFIQLDDEDPPSQQQPSRREPSPEVDWTGGGQLPKATAMYEFLAARSDEINMVCNERVVLLGTGDGEDWVKVRSLLDGKAGLVPRAFLSIDPTPPPAPPHPAVPALAAKSDTEQEPSDKTPLSPTSSPSEPVALPHLPVEQCLAGQFVRALIDFAGTAEDELSFGVGAVIHVLGQPAAGEVDDGWIEGELVPLTDAETTTPPACGVFPSMLVETVTPEDIWQRRLSASRPRPAKALLSTGSTADAKVSPSGERRCKPLSSSGSVPSPRLSNSASRSKSRSASAKRSWGGGGSGGPRRSTVSHNTSSSHRSSHRQQQQQQQHHGQQGRETSTGHGRVSRSLVSAKVTPSQASLSSAEAHPPASTHQQQEPSPFIANKEGRIGPNQTYGNEELQIAEL